MILNYIGIFRSRAFFGKGSIFSKFLAVVDFSGGDYMVRFFDTISQLTVLVVLMGV